MIKYVKYNLLSAEIAIKRDGRGREEGGRDGGREGERERGREEEGRERERERENSFKHRLLIYKGGGWGGREVARFSAQRNLMGNRKKKRKKNPYK